MSPSATGSLVNTVAATAGAGSTDANPGNNSATDADTTGIAQVDLGIAKTDGQGASPGSPITCALIVTKSGPSAAAASASRTSCRGRPRRDGPVRRYGLQ